MLKAGNPQAIAATSAWVSQPKAASAQARDSSSPVEESVLIGQQALYSDIRESYLPKGSEG